MIKLNTPYHVTEENVTVTFTEVKNGAITGTYPNATLTGTLEGNVLSATFHNSAVNAVGLIELTFNENGFEGKWKSGLEPGPMRGKWSGKIVKSELVLESEPTNSVSQISEEQKQYIDEGVNLEDFDEEYQGGDDGKVTWMKEKAFLMEAVKQDGSILKHASAELKADRELVLEALKNDIACIDYADEKLRYNPQLLIARIIIHFDGDENISIGDEDINIFVDECDFFDPKEAIEKLMFKVEYIILKNKKEEFETFHKKIMAFVNSNHECFWLLQAVMKKLESVENNSSWFEEDPNHYGQVCNFTQSFELSLNFEPSIEFETYFNDSEINSNWDDCKWASNEDEVGLPFTEFIMSKSNIQWDTESWSEVKYYNQAISRLWIGLQNYSLKQSDNGFDEDGFAVLFHEVIAEKYEPIQDSGSGHYGSYVFETVVEYLLGFSANDYNLNESSREDLEEFNGWQYDLKRLGLECDCDLFDDWPGATEFAKKRLEE